MLIDQIGDALLPCFFFNGPSHEETAGVYFWETLDLARRELMPMYQAVIYRIDSNKIVGLERGHRDWLWKTDQRVPFYLLEIVDMKLAGREVPTLRRYIEKLSTLS